MNIHILGICGTFMGGLAQILVEEGHKVSGTDDVFYPPMSDILKELNIETSSSYDISSFPNADLYVIGNSLSRGNIFVEHILKNNLPFSSGPEMLGRVLKNKKVIAVAGTHGKTTTAYMIAHILRSNSIDAGFLIGGACNNFTTSASRGNDKMFVVEADEYDSAFFDKRSKFIHYNPSTFLINNIEFDHADIFVDIDDIKRQFHHAIKIIPQNGSVIYFAKDKNSEDVIKMGSWCNLVQIGENSVISYDIKSRKLIFKDKSYSLDSFNLFGEHNFKNYVSAIVASYLNGIDIEKSIESLTTFKGVKRRLELIYNNNEKIIFSDFAHHPTAINFVTKSLKERYKSKKVLGILELGSNTMSSGYHSIENLVEASSEIEHLLILDSKESLAKNNTTSFFNNHQSLIEKANSIMNDYDIILIMTNKDFTKISKPLIEYLEQK